MDNLNMKQVFYILFLLCFVALNPYRAAAQIQTRTVSCRDTTTGLTVSDSLCNPAAKPAILQACAPPGPPGPPGPPQALCAEAYFEECTNPVSAQPNCPAGLFNGDPWPAALAGENGCRVGNSCAACPVNQICFTAGNWAGACGGPPPPIICNWVAGATSPGAAPTPCMYTGGPAYPNNPATGDFDLDAIPNPGYCGTIADNGLHAFCIDDGGIRRNFDCLCN